MDYLGFLFNGIGIVGVTIVITAFFMNQQKQIASDSVKYLVMNLVGSLFIITSIFWKWNLPSLIINTIWSIISIYGLLKKTKLFSKLKKYKKSAAKKK